MPDIIIGPPPETRWQRNRGKIRIPAVVLAAFVAGIFGLIGLWYGSKLESPQLLKKIDSLQGQLNKQKELVKNKDTEIQRLETLLTPFRTIALEKYTGSETEALKKLADKINELQKSDIVKTQKIVELEKNLADTKALAEPNKIVFFSKVIKKADSSLIVSLRFKPTKNEPLGFLVFAAHLPKDSKEKILNFWPSAKSTPFQSGPDSKKITDDGKSARLAYGLVGFGYPSIDLELTGPTKVKVEGNNELETFILDIF